LENNYMKAEKEIVVGALLHDIGKVVQRAQTDSKRREKHTKLGADWLSKIGIKPRDYSEYSLYHHAEEVENTENKLIHYVALADNFSAFERPQRGEDVWERNQPLRNIFDLIDFEHPSDSKSLQTFWPLSILETDSEGYIIPVFPSSEVPETLHESYTKILENLGKYFKDNPKIVDDPDKLLLLLEKYLSFVPSETNIGENVPPDISLYDHLKTTAMIAVCMRRYIYDEKPSDIGLHSSYPELKDFFDARNVEAFLLVHGDISGVQKFIYTITSKGALRSLRARSFYLQILQERVVERILEELHLYRVNIHYIGGGNFYLILPNTQRIIETLEKVSTEFNNFLQNEGLDLHLIIDWIPFGAREFENMKRIFEEASKKVNIKKLHPYSKEQLKEFFSITKADKETCKICGKRTDQLYTVGDSDEKIACKFCWDMYNLGSKLPKAEFLYPVEKPKPTDIKIFDRYYSIVTKLDTNRNSGFVLKYFSALDHPGKLWPVSTATYIPEANDMDILAKKAIGAKKIGVLRGDVDNLGRIFSEGFSSAKNYPPTLSRISTLSRMLTLFFSHYLPAICARKLPVEELCYSIVEQKCPRNVVIVYSGGDDFFIVGAWNEVFEIAVEINKAFKAFTGNNPKLSVSMGYILDHSKAPIYRLAKEAGKAENKAKNNKKDGHMKNSITILPSVGNTPLEDVFFWNEVEQITHLLSKLLSTSKLKNGKIYATLDRAFIYKLFGIMSMKSPFARPIMAYIVARAENEEKKIAEEILTGNLYEKLTLKKALQIYDLLARGGDEIE